MPAERVSTDISIVTAIRDILLTLVREDGSALTPQMTLTSPTTAGATSVALDDMTNLGSSMLLDWLDDSGEPTVAISQDWDGASSPIPLDFTGDVASGLVYAHDSGAKVVTNLFTEVPNNIDSMLLGPLPLIYIVVLDQRDYIVAGHQNEPNFTVHIEYRRSLVQKKTDPTSGERDMMNTNIFAFRQQRAARIDLELIARALRDNPDLTTSKGMNAIGIGDPNNAIAPRFQKTWTKIIVDANTQQFAAAGELMIRGFRETFYGV